DIWVAEIPNTRNLDFDTWDAKRLQQLAQRPYFMIILSPHTQGDMQISMDVMEALTQQRAILPVLHQDSEIPELLASMQRVDCRGLSPHEAVQEFMRSLGVARTKK